MKPIPAIVEKAQVDVDLIAEQIIVAIGEMRAADKSALRHDQQATDARVVARDKRLTVGRMLARVRGAWPARGPAPANGSNWSDFLAKIGIAESTAREYMAEAKDPQGFADRQRNSKPTVDDSDDDTGPRITLDPDGPREAPPFRQPTEDDLIRMQAEVNQGLARLDDAARKRVLKAGKPANVAGGSGEVERGTWCTSKRWAEAVGPFDHDPFSNPRSHIASTHRCMLEDGGDAFGGGKPGASPGLYLLGEKHGARSGVATADTRVWFQSPYNLVLEALAHYGHTRFVALLRWSPDVEWFRRLWPLIETVAFPVERMDFEPPPGIAKPESSIPYPHALYYRDHRDVTDEVRARCIILHIDHTTGAALPNPAQLHLVR